MDFNVKEDEMLIDLVTPNFCNTTTGWVLLYSHTKNVHDYLKLYKMLLISIYMKLDFLYIIQLKQCVTRDVMKRTYENENLAVFFWVHYTDLQKNNATLLVFYIEEYGYFS